MDRRALLLLFAALAVSPTFMSPQATEPTEEVTAESVYTREDVDKAKKDAYKTILKGAIGIFGSAIGYKVGQYILKNCARYNQVRYVSTGRFLPFPIFRMIGGPEDAIGRRAGLPPEGQQMVDEAIFGEIPDANYWDTTGPEDINEQLRGGGIAWMDKLWNFPMPNNPASAGILVALLTAIPVGAAVGSAGAIVMGIIQLCNLPKEGDPKELSPEEALAEQEPEEIVDEFDPEFI